MTHSSVPLYLRTLGGLALENGGRPIVGAAGQRGRLALLSVIALAGDLGVSRDRLLLLFWPESDTERARGALKQALYALRRDVGEQDLTLGTATLRLNPAVIRSDVAEFERAVAAGALEIVAKLYAGPFLDGVHLDAGAEFEQWVEAERGRLSRSYAQTLEALARQADSRGDHLAAVETWQRLVTLDPLNTRWTIGLIEALSAAGDRAGALGLATRHEATLRAEVGLPADPALTALVVNLRSTPPALSQKVAVTTSPPAAARLQADLSWQRDTTSVRASRAKRRLWFGLAAGAALVVGGTVFAAGRHRGPPLDQNLVAVVPFQVASPRPELRPLGNDIVTLFWMKLTGDAGPRAADLPTLQTYLRRVTASDSVPPTLEQSLAAARGLGAGRLVVGAISGTETRIEVTAYLRDVPSGRLLAHYTVVGPPDSIAAYVDALVVGLISSDLGVAADRLPDLGRFKPEAVREYLAGLKASGTLETWDEARRHFTSALQEDSGFVLAGVYAYRLGEGDESLARWCWDHQNALSERDRLLLRSLAGRIVVPSWGEAERLSTLEELVTQYPESRVGREEFAAALLTWGNLAGMVDWEGTARSLYERSIQDAPASLNDMLLMLEAAAQEGDTTGVRFSLHAIANVPNPPPREVVYARWVAARFFGDTAGLAQVWSVLDTAQDGKLWSLSSQALRDGRSLGDAERALARIHALGDPDSVVTMSLAFEQGRYRDYLAWRSGYPPDALRVRDALYSGISVGDEVRDALRNLERISARAVPPRPAPQRYQVDEWGFDELEEVDLARCWLAQWDLAHGKDAGIETTIRVLRRDPLRQGHVICAALLELQLAERRGGDVRNTALRLDSISRSVPVTRAGVSPSFMLLENVILAQTFLRLGDPARALAAARRNSGPNWAWVWPSQVLAEGRAAAMLGDTAAALRAYDHYLLLRAHADYPPWIAELDSARAERARLVDPRR